MMASPLEAINVASTESTTGDSARYLTPACNLSPLHRLLQKLPHKNLAGRVQSVDRYTREHGGHSDVFVGRCVTEDGVNTKKVAIKRLRFHVVADGRLGKRLVKEIYVWARLDHRNVLPFYGFLFEKDAECPSLISEWMDNGTAHRYVETHPDCDILQMVLGIAEGISYLHSIDIVHSDIKPANILISPSGDPLLCDFGISNKLSPSQSFSLGSSSTTGGIRGTIRYMARELLKPVEGGRAESKHSKESDIWAFGMTILELITKKHPFSHINKDIQVILSIMAGQIPDLPANFESLDTFRQNLWHICKFCWIEEPANRPVITSLKASLLSISSSDGREQLPIGLGLPSLDPRERNSRLWNTCNGCDRRIMGVSFQCAECPAMQTYILCSTCKSKSDILHDSSHVFFRLLTPWIDKALDHHVLCNGCSENIIGVRFQCAMCPSVPQAFNLCAVCDERSYDLHNPMHVFFQFTHSVDHPIESATGLLPVLYRSSAGLINGKVDLSHPKAYLESVKHDAVVCDSCMVSIRGEWFRCAYCEKDLCSKCESVDTHDNKHFFYVLKAPVTMSIFRVFTGKGDNPSDGNHFKHHVYTT